ncbi:hypothetical protein [Eubacterium callanderi]|uniref:hypothetical protein n=1 Tax=Eubacterium callanderi TaxID=53442 RepID=UPI0039843224
MKEKQKEKSGSLKIDNLMTVNVHKFKPKALSDPCLCYNNKAIYYMTGVKMTTTFPENTKRILIQADMAHFCGAFSADAGGEYGPDDGRTGVADRCGRHRER